MYNQVFKSRMTSPKGMDKAFWGKDMEDVFDWTKRLWMVIEVWELDEEKLFKITKFNLRGKPKIGTIDLILLHMIGHTSIASPKVWYLWWGWIKVEDGCGASRTKTKGTTILW